MRQNHRLRKNVGARYRCTALQKSLVISELRFKVHAIFIKYDNNNNGVQKSVFYIKICL